jgi:hypothetical protein
MTTTVQTPAGAISHEVTVADVLAIHKEAVERYGAGRDALQGTRSKLSELLQSQCPPPGPELVTDAHRIAADKAKKADPNHTDAHHWLQKQHGMALWRENDRLILAAGVT